MSESSLMRLAQAIGYPADEIEANATKSAFAVDGYEVEVEEVGSGSAAARPPSSEAPQSASVLRLIYALELTGEEVLDLVKYATGRLLKESATLAYDAEKKSVFLWDEMDGGASDAELKQRFGQFLDSCDWWRERVTELEQKPIKIDEMVIRP